MSSTIIFVGVCYSIEPEDFICRLSKLFAHYNKSLAGVLIVNNSAHSLQSNAPRIEVLRGTNAHLDFSGYFEGLNHLLATNQNINSKAILFVNDSLFTKHASLTIVGSLFRVYNLLNQLKIPAIAGKTDSYKFICAKNPWSLNNSYVSTFCFLLNGLALPFFQQLLSDANKDDVLNLSLNDIDWGRELDPVMREYIRAHLIYEGSPYLWKTSNAMSAEILNRKAHCVYFEHRLSGLIGLHGATISINSGLRDCIFIYFAEIWSRILRCFFK
jgi:hypothetical protein